MNARADRLSSLAPEVSFQQSDVYLCLLVNRSHRSVRVIDFRAGPSSEKRRLIVAYAREHGIERLFTLVERDEVTAWVRLGFSREGTIPSYYKRSDAYVLGADPEALALTHQSGTRPALRQEFELRSAAEPVYRAARKLASSWTGASPAVRVQAVPEDEALKALGRSGRQVAPEPFSRGAERWCYACSARGGFSMTVSVESQPCFDNACLELLVTPRSDKEAQLMARALHEVATELESRGIIGCFALSPVDDPNLAAIYLKNGFRRTGILNRHLRAGSGRTNAFLWSRKLAQPLDP